MSYDLKLVWLFIIGMFLAFLFFIEEVITENVLVEKYGLVKVFILVFINSIIGGLVMVITYYGLVQFVPEWHEYLKVGLAGATAMLGKDLINLYYRVIKKRVEKGVL